MKLEIYCISIFLKHSDFDSLEEGFRTIGLDGKLVNEFSTDQTGEDYFLKIFNFNGLNIFFLKENDFHKSLDFEIGLTTKNEFLWQKNLEKLKANNSIEDIGTLASGSKSKYAVFSKKNMHSPFFGIFEKSSWEPKYNDYFEFYLPKVINDFYKQNIFGLINHKYRDKICSNYISNDLPKIKKLVLSDLDLFEKSEFLLKTIKLKRYKNSLEFIFGKFSSNKKFNLTAPMSRFLQWQKPRHLTACKLT